jgi:plastocyanin
VNIDLTNNISLSYLGIENNNLTEIDVSLITALGYFKTNNNTNLSCIQINSNQLDDINTNSKPNWSKDNSSSYSLNFNPQTYSINVTASSASDYTLSGSDRNGNVTGNDPSVTIKVGDTIDFAVDASGHPFYLKTVQGTGTSDLVNGVTNNGATNGTVSWTPTAAGTYYYQCSLHNGMYGTITVN